MAVTDSPYAMWLRGDLAEYLKVRDGTRVEIIGGRVVVSPMPSLGHNWIIHGIRRAFVTAELQDDTFPWQTVEVADLNLSTADGYVPDVLVMDADVYDDAAQKDLQWLAGYQVNLVVEVTSSDTAGHDREPASPGGGATKWAGYSRAGIPFFLLVDRDPAVSMTALFAGPDRERGVYASVRSWSFGETVDLPDPFKVTIPTDDWRPWA
ncbi:Uma2 family endonuclease [Nonomuraea typhae]|uniref:Uma2 family endonuclease n=1 Tax=Nonomuraea typhae TaxID=2603600 RepID=UPI0012FA7C56|nr:Uma2 family endonuclease [Nonomuraea typhae]